MKLNLDGRVFAIEAENGKIVFDCLGNDLTCRLSNEEAKSLCCALISAAIDVSLDVDGEDGDE